MGWNKGVCRSKRVLSPHETEGRVIIVLGVILLILGLVLGISILTTVGIILLLVGVVFFILGSTGHAVGGRSRWY